jgi:hypothetical protein
MTSPSSPEFSYDLYPGLDAELEAALARNIANGEANAGDVASSGLAAVVGSVLNKRESAPLRPEVVSWAAAELESAGSGWSKYMTVLGPQALSLSESIRETHHDFNNTIDLLHSDRQYLIDSGYRTPEGTQIGETMKLVLVPWQYFRDALDKQEGIDSAIHELREEQLPSRDCEDSIDDDLLQAVNNNEPMYRSLVGTGPLMTASEYLDERIDENGPWGIMLAQTSNDAGMLHQTGQSPDQLTTISGRSGHMLVGTILVDAMGIFEWWALTLQEDPSQLSNAASLTSSWLLANRINVRGDVQVPTGLWNSYGYVGSSLDGAIQSSKYLRPRLAVL